jgi:hypothetical protein
VGIWNSRPGLGAWREYVLTRVGSLGAQAQEAAASRNITRDGDGAWQAEPGDADARSYLPVLREIDAHLADARRCAQEWGSPFDWLSGQRVEGAWFRVHHVEALLLTVLKPEVAGARIPDIAATTRSYLPSDDPRRVLLERKYHPDNGRAEKLGPADVLFLADTMRAAYFFNAVEYSRVRNFRNVVLVAALIMTTIVSGVLVVGSRRPGALPVCFDRPAASPSATPRGATPVATPTPGLICPSSDEAGRTQQGGDVLLIGLLGLLGAGLAAARALTTADELPTRYSPVVAQSLLKLPVGIATAVFGIVALRAGFVPGVSTFDDQADILVWALVFGFAQQALTGLIDDRGAQLLTNAAPGTPAATPQGRVSRRRRH